MSIKDEIGKLAQSLLTLDDLVLVQNLAQGGFGQLGKVSMSASGPSIAFNVGARALFLGAQLATKGAELPLTGEAEALAGKAGEHAKSLGERCSLLALQGIELAGGKKATNPITKEDWLAKHAPEGYTSGELAADSTFGTARKFALKSFALGLDALRMRNGGVGAESMIKAVGASMDKIPGTPGLSESAERRQGLAAVAMESGIPLAATLLALAEAIGRLGLADTRALHDELTTGLERARLLAKEGSKEGKPAMPVSAKLRETAKRVADNPPEHLIAALKRRADGKGPSATGVFGALIKDSRALAMFFTMYPQILSMLWSDLMLMAGPPVAIKGAQSVEKLSDDDGTSAGFILLESLVGSAVSAENETPLFSRATIFLAQDLSYDAQRDRHGSHSALERAQRLFGQEVLDRLSSDVSLDHNIMGAEGPERSSLIRGHIASLADDNVLAHHIALCKERLSLLETSAAGATLTLTAYLADRIHALRLFTSIGGSELGLRAAQRDSNDGSRTAFFEWAEKQD